MLKILYNTGKEENLNGEIHFYSNNNYKVTIEGRKENDFANLKLVYDVKSKESLYFNLFSYGFHKGIDKYEDLYKRSKRELNLIENFKELIVDSTVEKLDMNNINALSDWMVFCEDEIKEIYNKNK